MEALWWSCMLGVLCVSQGSEEHAWTVSQEPPSVALMRVNLSAEMTCSTSLDRPTGLYLKRHFHRDTEVIYVALDNRLIRKITPLREYLGRIAVVPALQGGRGYTVTIQLSLLRPHDTDVYYCSWTHLDAKKGHLVTLNANGTIIIVRERDPLERCAAVDSILIFIVPTVTALTMLLVLFIVALIHTCSRFKRQFRPARSSLNRHQHDCPQHRGHRGHRGHKGHRGHCPPHTYQSTQTPDLRGFQQH